MRTFGRPGDRFSLARVYTAIVAATVVGGILGYAIDLLIGPLVGQAGWWTVFGLGGAIAGAALQGVREYAVPPSDRRPRAAPSSNDELTR